ncbi:MAG: hypothetical protein JXR29_11425 [Methylothermaceae bacterium]|nr:hypothetical protein [Methylothermaceae bacterium]
MMRWFLVVIVTLMVGLIFVEFRPKRPVAEQTPVLARWVDWDAFPPLPDRPLRFPRDHGGHVEAPLETWQLQGILTTPTGRRLGFQLHIFALGLRPGAPQRPSAWASHRYFLAYFTRTDPDAKTFHVERRYERAALGLSGAAEDRVWVDDWILEFNSDRLRFKAGQRENYLKLALKFTNPPIASPENPANLHVYRFPRTSAQGRWGKEPVSGNVWLQHAWGAIPLPGGPVSLHRFQLQMEKGGNLLCLQLQRSDTAIPGPVQCFWTEPGEPQKRLTEVRITPISRWRSPGGQIYPIAWRLESSLLDLDIEAVLPDQRIGGALPFWSGWVRIRGRGGQGGEGFVQIIGRTEEVES